MVLPVLGIIAAADIAVTAVTGKDIVQHVTGFDWMGSAAAAIDNTFDTNLYEYVGGDGSGLYGMVTGETLEFENGSLLDCVTGGHGGSQLNILPDDGGSGGGEEAAESSDTATIIQAIQDSYNSVMESLELGFQSLSTGFSQALTELGGLVNSWGTILLAVGVTGVLVGIASLFSGRKTRKLISGRRRR